MVMNEDIIHLYGEYTRGGLSRRAFLDALAKLVGGSAAALALLPALEAAQTQTPQTPIVAEDDSRLATGRIDYDAAGTKMTGYLARLKGGRKRPGVIVIHENRGLNPHIQDVARRFAVDGFLALAPDALSPLGGTPADETEATKLIGSLNQGETVARLAAAVKYLAAHPESTGKVGVVGFCWGGGMVNQLTAAGTSLNAGVAYYGRQLPAADVPKITAPIMFHYGSLDTRINAGIAEYEAALKANNKIFETHMYEGANHAFNNNTNQTRFNKEAADLAWSRTVAFFKKYLGA
jgi:carboxymethylenebutenolidase